MIPRRVSLQNFLSFGAKQEIEFADDEPLWCISGPNGVGKSAVFDAITYCLFAKHRGGKQGAQNLIKHGESGFTVGFEFAIDRAAYRITRSLGKKTTQSVERLDADGTWKVIPDLNGATAVDDWVKETVGLDFEAFTASVMLRQGEAADIVNATGKKRHEILSKVIGLERFQTLAVGIADAAKGKRTSLDNLLKRKAAEPEIEPAEIQAADVALAAADAAGTQAEADKATAAELVIWARRWAELHGDHAKVKAVLTQAAQRAGEAEAIRSRKERFDELEKVLPPLMDWIALRNEEVGFERQKAELEPRLTAARALLETAERTDAETRAHCENLRQLLPELERRVMQLKSESERLTQQAILAGELEQLDAELAAYPADLGEQVDVALAERDNVETAERKAEQAFTEANTEWNLASKLQAKIETLDIGVKCDRCGQEVTADHAENERRSIAGEVQRLAALLDRATSTRSTARNKSEAAKSAHGELHLRFQAFHQCERLRRAKDETLTTLGVHDPANLLRQRAKEAELDRQRVENERASATGEFRRAETAARGAEHNLKIARTEAKATEASAAELNQQAAVLEDRHRSLTVRLDVRYHAIPEGDAARLRTEFEELQRSDVRSQFEALLGDLQMNDERQRGLAELESKMSEVPDAGRVPVAEAQRGAEAAAQGFSQAERHFTQARDTRRSLEARAEASAKLRGEILEAEAEDRLHARLRDLLGRNGLQRELLREAEAEIVGHADTIVRNLSNGDLSLELDPNEKKDDEALVLRVHRPESPVPTPVMFLSGSQKFRVAIALALAIGRFATTGARPIECVIIDEGFGSLDKDGLEATAQELKRLKEYLKRIILVSHQEEFIEHFPMAIRLKPGEAGTVVEGSSI